MGAFEKFKESRFAAPTIAIVLIAVGVLSFFQIRGILGASPDANAANNRIFICSETGKSFHVSLASLDGKTPPIYSSYSGKDTAYPAELCYWTADGHVKKDPTPVLLNVYLGKPGKTFCPDCHRLVVVHNPVPGPDSAPPPTQQEWEARHKN